MFNKTLLVTYQSSTLIDSHWVMGYFHKTQAGQNMTEYQKPEVVGIVYLIKITVLKVAFAYYLHLVDLARSCSGFGKSALLCSKGSLIYKVLCLIILTIL